MMQLPPQQGEPFQKSVFQVINPRETLPKKPQSQNFPRLTMEDKGGHLTSNLR
jgi:hypothetical protein